HMRLDRNGWLVIGGSPVQSRYGSRKPINNRDSVPKRLDQRPSVAGQATPVSPLPHLVFHFAQPVWTLQHFTRLAAIRRSDDALALHHVENTRRAPITQSQTAL